MHYLLAGLQIMLERKIEEKKSGAGGRGAGPPAAATTTDKVHRCKTIERCWPDRRSMADLNERLY
jgi:hypothetical protein